MTKRMTSIRLSDMTDRQLAELSQRTGMNQSDIISIAIDRMAREERTNMTRTIYLVEDNGGGLYVGPLDDDLYVALVGTPSSTFAEDAQSILDGDTWVNEHEHVAEPNTVAIGYNLIAEYANGKIIARGVPGAAAAEWLGLPDDPDEWPDEWLG